VLTEAEQGNLSGFVASSRRSRACRDVPIVAGGTGHDVPPGQPRDACGMRDFLRNIVDNERFLWTRTVRVLHAHTNALYDACTSITVDGERREARRRFPRSYGRRKPDGCDDAETNTTPFWLVQHRREDAQLDSRAA
jgi:hypothetical protein